MINKASLGTYAGKAGVDYAAAEVRSRAGKAVSKPIANAVAQLGEKIAGPIGKAIGGYLGDEVAGRAVSLISPVIGGIGDLVRDKGYEVVEAFTGEKGACKAIAKEEASKPKQEKLQETKLIATAFLVAKVCAWIFGSVVSAFLNPVAGLLFLAAIEAVPKIIRALRAPAGSKKINLIDDVFVKTAKKIVFGSIGSFFGNLTRYNKIQSAFNSKVSQGQKIGKMIDAILPESLKGTAEKIGIIAGNIDGARTILSDSGLKSADKMGNTVEKIAEGGFDLADHMITKQLSSTSSSLYNRAKKGAWIGLGILSGVGLSLAAPAIAPIVVGTSLLSVFDRFVLWVKQNV